MVGVERRSCYSLKDMLRFGYNVLMYPLPSCGFQSLKCYSVIFHMACIISSNLACENVLLKTSPSFPVLLSSNHLPLPRDQSSYLQDEFSANTTSTATTTTLLHTTYKSHHKPNTTQLIKRQNALPNLPPPPARHRLNHLRPIHDQLGLLRTRQRMHQKLAGRCRQRRLLDQN